MTINKGVGGRCKCQCKPRSDLASQNKQCIVVWAHAAMSSWSSPCFNTGDMKQTQQPCLHSFEGQRNGRRRSTVNNMILAVPVRRELHTVHDAGHWIYYVTRKGGEEQVDESRARWRCHHRNRRRGGEIAKQHMHHNLEKRGRHTLC